MCFSLQWLENLLIWLVIVGTVIAILKLLIPWAFSFLGIGTGPLMQIITYVVYAVIAIMVIYIAFALISCLMGGSFHLPSLR